MPKNKDTGKWEAGLDHPLITHGLSSRAIDGKVHPLYRMLHSMKQRCYNKTHDNYHLYGAVGITICPEWLESNVNFFNWALASGWEDGLQIDRIEGSKGYSPENCRFVTRKENGRNRKTNRILTVFGVTACFVELVERFAVVTNACAWRRFNKYGWSLEKALMTPKVIGSQSKEKRKESRD